MDHARQKAKLRSVVLQLQRGSARLFTAACRPRRSAGGWARCRRSSVSPPRRVWLHESGTYVKLTQSGTDLFA